MIISSLKYIINNIDSDINIYTLFGKDQCLSMGLPELLGIDEFPLVKEEMCQLLYLDASIFDTMFGDKISKAKSIKVITQYINDNDN